MCGRFSLHSRDRIRLKGLIDIDLPFEPHYNIAPTQSVVVIGNFGKGIESRQLTWGLIPSWSIDGKGFINARGETLSEKPSFRDSFRLRRCLIPANGFYEWKRKGKEKRPYFIAVRNESVLMFAGIWDTWSDRGREVTSCAIVTTEPNELVAELHDRMPVIVSESDYELWLDKGKQQPELTGILAPYPAAEMYMYPVSQKVNLIENDSSDLIQPVDAERGQTMSLF